MLQYLATRCNAWHVVISALERRVFSAQDPQYFNQLQIKFRRKHAPALDALAKIYEKLGERDILCGLWNVRLTSDFTRAALAYEQFGLWPRAQEMFFVAMNKMHTSDVPEV